MGLNPRARNQPLSAVKRFGKLKAQHFKKNIAVPPLLVEGDDGCGIKLENKTKLVDNRTEKLTGLTD